MCLLLQVSVVPLLVCLSICQGGLNAMISIYHVQPFCWHQVSPSCFAMLWFCFHTKPIPGRDGGGAGFGGFYSKESF